MKKVLIFALLSLRPFLCACDYNQLLKSCSPVPILPDERNFEGKKLDGFNGRGKVLTGGNFKRSSLRNGDFRGAFLLGAHFEGADLSGAQFNGAQINDLYVDEKTIVDSRTMFVGVSCNKETTDRLASFFWRCEEAKKWMHPD